MSARNPGGMPCPKCYAGTGVYKTVHNESSSVRYRSCAECGYKFLTLETVLNESVQGDGRHGGKRTKRDFTEDNR